MRALASWISTICNPLMYCTLYFATLAADGAPLAQCLACWALVAVLPGALLFGGVRAGIWSDLDLVQLKERRTYLPWVALFALAAVALAWRGAYVRPVLLSTVGIAVWLLASALVSLFWKVSLHTGAALGIALLFWALLGPGAGVALLWSPLVVGWARLTLKRHDLGQVIAGLALGAAAVWVAVAAVG